MTEHRVPMLGSLRRYEDPAHSADPAIRGIVTANDEIAIDGVDKLNDGAEIKPVS